MKLSSPTINNFILFGCILAYSSVFMATSRFALSSICKVGDILNKLFVMIVFTYIMIHTKTIHCIDFGRKPGCRHVDNIAIKGFAIRLLESIKS